MAQCAGSGKSPQIHLVWMQLVRPIVPLCLLRKLLIIRHWIPQIDVSIVRSRWSVQEHLWREVNYVPIVLRPRLHRVTTEAEFLLGDNHIKGRQS